MGRARRDILYDGCLAHVTFKCHNSSFYFKEDAIKQKLIAIVAKHKKKYGVQIFDWVFMSTHPHFLVYVKNVDVFSNFMRQTNRDIAELINGHFNKTGQVIQDRYRSPVIENEVYTLNTIDYIWLNPVRAGITSIEKACDYRFSSLFYRHRGLKDPIADSYEKLQELSGVNVTEGQSEQRFTRDHLNALISKELSHLGCDVMEHLHSLGGLEYVLQRKSFRWSNSTAPP